MFFVEARYHHSPKRAAGQVRYIAHREEGRLDTRTAAHFARLDGRLTERVLRDAVKKT